jgi:hypothetical protein
MTSTVSAAGLMEPRHRYTCTTGSRTPDPIKTPVPAAPGQAVGGPAPRPDVTGVAVIGLPDDEPAEVPAGYVVVLRRAAACAGCSANLLGPDPLSLCRPGPICSALHLTQRTRTGRTAQRRACERCARPFRLFPSCLRCRADDGSRDSLSRRAGRVPHSLIRSGADRHLWKEISAASSHPHLRGQGADHDHPDLGPCVGDAEADRERSHKTQRKRAADRRIVRDRPVMHADRAPTLIVDLDYLHRPACGVSVVGRVLR